MTQKYLIPYEDFRYTLTSQYRLGCTICTPHSCLVMPRCSLIKSYQQIPTRNTNNDRIPSVYGQVYLPFFVTEKIIKYFFLDIHTNNNECTSLKLVHAVSLCFKHLHGSTRHTMSIYGDVKFMICHLFQLLEQQQPLL